MNQSQKQQGDVLLKKIDSLPDARYLKMLNPSIGVWHVEGVQGNTVDEAINFRAGRVISASESWSPAVLS